MDRSGVERDDVVADVLVGTAGEFVAVDVVHEPEALRLENLGNAAGCGAEMHQPGKFRF